MLVDGCVQKFISNLLCRLTLVSSLKRRFIFMGILNAIFAPLIVSYFLMYSFFRYFEVRLFIICLAFTFDLNFVCRNITRILLPLVGAGIRPLRNGNLGNSTNFLISL